MTSSASPDQIHTQPETYPYYNSEPFLKECLDGLLGQTCGDWEVICINDGSTDGSTKILADYAARGPRIHVLSLENRGLGATHSKGITEAHGLLRQAGGCSWSIPAALHSASQSVKANDEKEDICCAA